MRFFLCLAIVGIDFAASFGKFTHQFGGVINFDCFFNGFALLEYGYNSNVLLNVFLAIVYEIIHCKLNLSPTQHDTSRIDRTQALFFVHNAKQ